MTPIPYSRGYYATEEGEIIGARGRKLRPTLNYAGYLVCDVHKRQYRVNRLVCEAFHGPPPSEKHVAAHRDGDRTNNKPDNLYWATADENGADMRRHGTAARGSKSWKAVLTEAEVKDIRARSANGERTARIRERYPNVCPATVYHIVNGRTWGHV